MTRKNKEVFENPIALDLSMLKPGPQNTLTGVPLEQARAFGQKVAAERKVEFREYEVKPREQAYNMLQWMVRWKASDTFHPLDGTMQDLYVVTDYATETEIIESPWRIRGTRELGTYLLVIPISEDSPIVFDDYSKKQASTK